MFTHFDKVPERHRQTDGQTPYDGISSRGKNRGCCFVVFAEAVYCNSF